GRARAALGDTDGGIAALRRAVELAPNYAEQRWHLGNALLRAGRNEEAFAELRRAADADPDKYRPQVFNLAWQVYGPDMARVIDAVGKTPAARAQLVGVLAGRGRLDRKSTRLNSSHRTISYAVFCLKKKKKKTNTTNNYPKHTTLNSTAQHSMTSRQQCRPPATINHISNTRSNNTKYKLPH